MKLIMIRHGEPDYENDCLTERGHLQAEAVAEKLLRYGITSVYASSKGRAVQTAEHFAQKAGLPVTQLDFIREYGYVRREFKGDPEILEQCQIVRRGREYYQDGRDILQGDFSDFYPWSGEKSYIREKCEAIGAGLDEWLATLGYEREGLYYRCTRENEDTVALFSHGNSGRAAVSHLLHLHPVYGYALLRWSVTGISVFQFKSEPGELVFPALRTWNDHSHIIGLTDPENEV